MAFLAGAIVSKLVLNKKEWEQSIKSVKADQTSLKGFILNNSREIQGLGKGLAVAGAAVTATFGILTKKTVDAGDAINDLSQRYGIATDVLSGLKLSADKSGTSLEGVAVGMKGLANRIDDANKGGKESVKMFKDLGIEIHDAEGKVRPMNDILLDVSDRFANMPDGATKSALAMDLFAKSGGELIPMLNLGKKGLEENYEITKELGGLWNQESASAADGFNDSLAELQLSAGGLGKEIVMNLLPGIKGFVDDAKDIIVKVRTWAAEHPGLVSGLSKTAIGLGVLAGTLGPVLIMLPKMVEWIQRLKVISATPIVIAVTVAIPVIAKAISDFRAELDNMRESMKEAGSSGFMSTLEGINSGIRRVTLGIKDSNIVISEANAGAKLFAKEGGRGMKDVLLEVKESAEDIVPPLKDLKEELGLTFRADVEERIKKLNEALVRYKGKFTADEIIRIRTEINELSEKLKGWKPNAEEGARAVTQMLDDIFAKMDEVAGLSEEEWGSFTDQMQLDFQKVAEKDIPAHLKGIPKAAKEVAGETRTFFDALWSDIARGFGSTLQEWMSGATTFKDFMVGLWGDIKDAIFAAIGEEVTKALMGLFDDVIGKTKDVGKSITDNIKGALGNAGSTAGSMAGSFLSAASSIANIVTAVASVISLFKKAPTGAGDGMGRVVERQDQQTSLLTSIKDFCLNDIHVGLVNLGRIMDSLLGGGAINGLLKKIDLDILGLKSSLSGMVGASEGAVLTEPQVVMTHGTRERPEYILRPEQLGAAAASQSRGSTRPAQGKMVIQVPIYIGTKKIQEEVFEIVEAGTQTGRLRRLSPNAFAGV